MVQHGQQHRMRAGQLEDTARGSSCLTGTARDGPEDTAGSQLRITSLGKMAHGFRVFMGRRGPTGARHTADKGVLPDVLLAEMRSYSVRYLNIFAALTWPFLSMALMGLFTSSVPR